MTVPVDWQEKVVQDYRERIIIDPDNAILAFKATRDRYGNLPKQAKYAGLPHLGSWQSEDALTWNVFRSFQNANSLGIITSRLGIGHPRGLLLWTLAPVIDEVNAELQFTAGALIRKFDGIFPGQTTEPDVILLGTTGIGVMECKLSEPHKAPVHLWEGDRGSVQKRRPIYDGEIPDLIAEAVSDEEIVPVYQLVRMAFYAIKLGSAFKVEPIVVSLANKENWSLEIRKLAKSPLDLWHTFHTKILRTESPRCTSIFWQDLKELAQTASLATLSGYLSSHPCLY